MSNSTTGSGYFIRKKDLPTWHDNYDSTSEELIDLEQIAFMDDGEYLTYGSNLDNYKLINGKYFVSKNNFNTVPFKDTDNYITAFKDVVTSGNLIGATWKANTELNPGWPGGEKHIIFTTADGVTYESMCWTYVEDGGNDGMNYLYCTPTSGTDILAYTIQDNVTQGSWNDSSFKILHFIGGDAFNDPDLINWLNENGKLTFAAVEGLTKYPIYKGTEGLRTDYHTNSLNDTNHIITSSCFITRTLMPTQWETNNGWPRVNLIGTYSSLTSGVEDYIYEVPEDSWAPLPAQYVSYLELCGGGGTGGIGTDYNQHKLGYGGGGAATICVYIDWNKAKKYFIKLEIGKGGKCANNFLTWRSSDGEDSWIHIYLTRNSSTPAISICAPGGKGATTCSGEDGAVAGKGGGYYENDSTPNTFYYMNNDKNTKYRMNVGDCLYGITLLNVVKGGDGGGVHNSYKEGNQTYYFGSEGGASGKNEIKLFDRSLDDTYSVDATSGGLGGVQLAIAYDPGIWGNGGGSSLHGWGGRGGSQSIAQNYYGGPYATSGTGYGAGGGGGCYTPTLRYDNTPGNGSDGAAFLYAYKI